MITSVNKRPNCDQRRDWRHLRIGGQVDQGERSQGEVGGGAEGEESVCK